jgi:hypothetical protein
VELTVCAEWLPHGDATISRAYSDLRPATAHLVSVTNKYVQGEDIPGRFLSISQMLFEIGDKTEIESIYNTVISKDALWSYLVSAKQREVLAPNLPLAFGVLSADGYDGGLLPLASYITFTHLLIEDGTQDGRLRENLTEVPDRRWLQLMDVRYIITDKVSDLWIDGILYDLQFNPVLLIGDELSVAWLPDTYEADAIGLIYKGRGGQTTIEFEDGSIKQYQLPEMSEEKPYRVRWDKSTHVISITLSANASEVTYKGLSLINEMSGSFYPLTLSDSYKLVHSGDVKIYEDMKPVNHAFFVPDCLIYAADTQALSLMEDESFDPLSTVILDGSGSAVCNGFGSDIYSEDDMLASSVRVIEYKESALTIEVQVNEPGFIVVSDAWYPGWKARLANLDNPGQSQAVPVFRGNLMFRAIPVSPGHWLLNMEFHSQYLLIGLVLSGIGIALLILYRTYFRSIT